MIYRNVSVWLRHPPVPGIQGFAVLAGLEAGMRGVLSSVWPLVLYHGLGSASAVSLAYLLVGFVALGYGMLVPGLGRLVPRRWLYTFGAILYAIGPALGIMGGSTLAFFAMMVTALAGATVFICTNAYIMDYIARHDLGRNETRKMVYSAISWAAGPVLGVWMWKFWHPLPFLVAIGFAVALLSTFWFLRLGNGKLISRARAPAPNPLAYLGRFFRQPRLIGGWLFATIRSFGWWVYIVYLPIFCIENGLGDQVGSFAYSASNLMLLGSPFMLRWMQPRGLRFGVRFAFWAAAFFFLITSVAGYWPPLAVIGFFLGSIFLVMLDAFGSLPFLLAVRPAERTEMSAVYASYRDVSGILAPGAAWLVLLVMPITGFFAVSAFGLFLTGMVAGRMHPKLGMKRSPVEPPEPANLPNPVSPTAAAR
ncbi:MAG: MFS transporter [Paracoccaceae bacterium]